MNINQLKYVLAVAASDLAYQAGNCRRGYWWMTNTLAVKMTMAKERLIRLGFYDLAKTYHPCKSTIETAVY